MSKTIAVLLVIFLSSTIGFGQKKKDLIKEIAQLRADVADKQSKLSDLQQAKAVNLEDDLQKFSYAFGLMVGKNLKTVGYDSLAYDVFAVALEDVMTGKQKMSVDSAQKHVQTVIRKMEEEKAKKSIKIGEAFLSENGKKPEIITTASGLQYEIITEGSGAIPVATDKVTVHYKGMLLDGEVFDSSLERNEPATFGVTGVIKGWQEALQLMPLGSKWRLYVPQDLAYGKGGAGGGRIPPYAVLIFEVELLEID